MEMIGVCGLGMREREKVVEERQKGPGNVHIFVQCMGCMSIKSIGVTAVCGSWIARDDRKFM